LESTAYYRKFIRSYGDIAAPLTQLLKEAFSWTPTTAVAFDALKMALATALVLQLPDFNKSFTVDCDASGFGFGAVLHQGSRPIAFFSHTILPHHTELAAYEHELIGLVKAVHHWLPYLWTRPFVVWTDHHSLKYLLDQQLSMIPQHSWVSKMFGYQFSVDFKQGHQNVAADALSQWDKEALEVNALSVPNFELFDQFRREAASLQEVIAQCEEIAAGTTDKGWAIVDDIIVHDGRVFMPATSKLWATVLEHAHGIDHEGVQKTLQWLRSSFYTLHGTKLVQEFVRGCSVRRCNKTEHLHPASLLQPLSVPDAVWMDISMDFVEGFPKVGGKSIIMTVIDRLSKYTHFVPLGHPYSTTSVAKAFFDQVVRLHGVPASIVSDRNLVFTNIIWQELFRLSGTHIRLKRMGSQKSATTSSPCICVVWSRIGRVHGCVGYPGLNIASILHIRQP
jgi:hypothetical protein